MHRFVSVAGIGAGVLLLAACAQQVPVPGAAPATSQAPSGPVQITISVPITRVSAGQTLHGDAVVTNTTATPVTVHGCPSTWLQVGLTNAQISYDPAIPDLACAPTIQLAPGPNRFPFTIQTTYPACTEPGGHSLMPMPTCAPGGLPALPAGTYQTKVVTDGVPGVAPAAPISITVLP